ncbi:MAG: MFS transporter [Sporolactobacillus sp.]
MSIGSWAIGGTLLLFYSNRQLVAFDVLIFIFAAGLMAFLPKAGACDDQEELSERAAMTIGWKTIAKNNLLKTATIMDVIETFANSVWIAAIVLVFVKTSLHASENWWGYINASYFAGAIIGGFVCYRWATLIDRQKGTFIFIGAGLTALATVCMSFITHPLVALGCSLMVGLFGQIKSIPQSTAIQQNVTNDRLAPVYAAMNVLYTASFSLSSLLIGGVAQWFGVQHVFILSAMLLVLTAAIAKMRAPLFNERQAGHTDCH